MKIGVLSDLHIDHNHNIDFLKILDIEVDILVIAGDISSDPGTTVKFIKSLDTERKYKTIFVLGNHDYWSCSNITKILEYYKKEFSSLKNSYFLNNTFVEIDGYKFAGTTGWFPGDYPNSMFPDYRYIGLLHLFKKDLYNQGVKFLEQNQGDKTIFVTHHVPYKNLMGPKESWDDIGLLYFCMHLKQLKCHTWIYGHTHKKYDNTKNKIKYINNPYGYFFENLNNKIQTFVLE